MTVRFFRTPAFLPWVYPSLTWRESHEGTPTIFLTFDDGPIPGPTEFVLDTLLQHRIHATFFCIGDNVRKHPAIFKKVIDSGHAIGNHTFHHMNGWKHSTDQYVANTQACREQLAAEGFQVSRLFRPPFGRITQSQISALKSEYRIVMWDVLTFDYDRSLAPERCLTGAIRATRPGSIVVFHDSLKAEKNLTFVLPRFIKHFKSQGYNFAMLS